MVNWLRKLALERLEAEAERRQVTAFNPARCSFGRCMAEGAACRDLGECGAARVLAEAAKPDGYKVLRGNAYAPNRMVRALQERGLVIVGDTGIVRKR